MLGIARRLGAGGFLLYLLYSLGVFVVLGAAWAAAAPGERPARVWRFTWARLIREAAADLLPFSQIGGIVLAARMLIGAGIGPARVYASLIADMTTEIASQLIFTLFGVAMFASVLLAGGDAAALRLPIFIGTAILIAIMALFIGARVWILPFAGRIAQHVLPGSAGATQEIAAELGRIYARRRRMLLVFALNLLGWIASAAGAWIALRLMGAEFSIWAVLAIEALIFTLRSAAFAIPGGIGVQEAGYLLCAPLLGLPAEWALALALAKRARDLAIAVPTLLIWQAGEARAVAVAAKRG